MDLFSEPFEGGGGGASVFLDLSDNGNKGRIKNFKSIKEVVSGNL